MPSRPGRVDGAARAADRQSPSHRCLPGPVLSARSSTEPSQQQPEGAVPILQAGRLRHGGWRAVHPGRSLVPFAPRPMLFTAPAAFLRGTGDRQCRELGRWQLLCQGDFTALGCLEKINTICSVRLAPASRETPAAAQGLPLSRTRGLYVSSRRPRLGVAPAWPALASAPVIPSWSPQSSQEQQVVGKASRILESVRGTLGVCVSVCA